MNTATVTSPAADAGLRGAWNRLADRAEALVSHAVIALAARIAVGSIFFISGRTKVEGVLTVTDNAVALFADEYQVPLLPPEFAAHMATYAEHALPILLFLGLATRLSALGLLGMTAVIQLFVYPAAWPTHLTWAMPLLYLIARGGGPVSADRALGIR